MLRDKLRKIWRVVRQLSGDDAYERYLRHCAERHDHEMPLSREEFFKRWQERKWSGVKRCC
jgi:uncharacterized short protein YbdD (DUF466 family)